MTAKPINEEVLSKEFEQLRNDFPSFLKQPVEEGLLPPRDWLVQHIEHAPCPSGEEANLVPHEISVTIPRDSASDELRAKRSTSQAKASVLNRLETLLLVGGLDSRLVRQNGLLTLPGDTSLRKDPDQGLWDFCQEAIKKYQSLFYNDSGEAKSLGGDDSEPSYIFVLPLKLKELLLAQGGVHDSCKIIDAALGKIELDGMQVLGSDLVNTNGMIVPRRILKLIFHPNLSWRFADKNRSSILVGFHANVLVKENTSAAT